MKTFGQIRELSGRKPTGKLVTNKRIGKIKVEVYKEPSGFVAYVDGDRLDRYRNEKEAMKAAEEFIKAYNK